MLTKPKKKTAKKRAVKHRNPKNINCENFANYLSSVNSEIWRKSTDSKLDLSTSMQNDLIEIQYLIEGLIIQLRKWNLKKFLNVKKPDKINYRAFFAFRFFYLLNFFTNFICTAKNIYFFFSSYRT